MKRKGTRLVGTSARPFPWACCLLRTVAAHRMGTQGPKGTISRVPVWYRTPWAERGKRCIMSTAQLGGSVSAGSAAADMTPRSTARHGSANRRRKRQPEGPAGTISEDKLDERFEGSFPGDEPPSWQR